MVWKRILGLVLWKYLEKKVVSEAFLIHSSANYNFAFMVYFFLERVNFYAQYFLKRFKKLDSYCNQRHWLWFNSSGIEERSSRLQVSYKKGTLNYFVKIITKTSLPETLFKKHPGYVRDTSTLIQVLFLFFIAAFLQSISWLLLLVLLILEKISKISI